MSMTYEDILKDLKDKKYKPVYLLMGEEPYYIDRVTDYIAKNVLSEEEKTFNQIVLYGKDTDIPGVIKQDVTRDIRAAVTGVLSGYYPNIPAGRVLLNLKAKVKHVKS